jgi:hypothetical protein
LPDGVAALADMDVFEELQHLNNNLGHIRELLNNIARYKADSVYERIDW